MFYKEKNHKPPLRKYNSFPYHMFMNDGYTSDESTKSASHDSQDEK